jgi:hypothetical protein
MLIHLSIAPYFDLFQKFRGELDVAMLLKFEQTFGSKIEKPANARKIDRLDGMHPRDERYGSTKRFCQLFFTSGLPASSSPRVLFGADQFI